MGKFNGKKRNDKMTTKIKNSKNYKKVVFWLYT